VVVLVIALSELGAIGIIKKGYSLVVLKFDFDRQVEVVVHDARDALVEVFGQVAVVIVQVFLVVGAVVMPVILKSPVVGLHIVIHVVNLVARIVIHQIIHDEPARSVLAMPF
jgi:hypothetical protein